MQNFTSFVDIFHRQCKRYTFERDQLPHDTHSRDHILDQMHRILHCTVQSLNPIQQFLEFYLNSFLIS